MKRCILTLIPLLIFVALVVFFIRRLELIGQGNMPNIIPSVLVGKPAPEFTLHNLYEKKPDVTLAGIKGRVTLVNIFASWCLPCRVEHPFLEEIKKAGIVLVGINYEDEAGNARAWLDKMGDPYDAVGSDRNGRAAIDFGAYGVPESYLLDKAGVIRFKQTGPLTPEIIHDQLLPLAAKLNQ